MNKSRILWPGENQKTTIISKNSNNILKQVKNKIKPNKFIKINTNILILINSNSISYLNINNQVEIKINKKLINNPSTSSLLITKFYGLPNSLKPSNLLKIKIMHLERKFTIVIFSY